MPNLIGQNFLDAKQNIEKAGFQVERIYTPTQDAVQDGKVATQNPVAGQQVFSDSKIGYVPKLRDKGLRGWSFCGCPKGSSVPQPGPDFCVDPRLKN
jgi:hypothetical protein